MLARRAALAAVLVGVPRRALCSMSNADAIKTAREGMSDLAAVRPPFALIETAAQAQSFLDAHDTFLFDCDGVLWRGEYELLPCAAQIEFPRN